jgi:general stress protein CsbA
MRYFAIILTLILLLASSLMMAFAGDWLNDAYRLMRAQLVIGVALFDGSNSASFKTLVKSL